LVELWLAGFGPAGVVEVNISWVDAAAGEGVVLVVGVLVCGGRLWRIRATCVDKGLARGLFDVVSRRVLSTHMLNVTWAMLLGCRQMIVYVTLVDSMYRRRSPV